MNEKFIAYGILSAFAPVVVMAFFDIQTGRGFWKDYLSVVLGIGVLAAFALGVAVLVWAVVVVLQ